MRKVNYKSDFDFIMRLKDASGKEVPFPECDWDALFWTSSKPNAYRVSCIGGVYVNCFREADGSIHFVFDNHRMGKGTLQWEPHFRFPNDIYPDGFQDQFRKAALGIELVDGDGDEPTEAEIEYILPYIKGDKGDTGPQGPKGDRGEQGVQGLKGDKGDKGDQGIQGIQGPKGDTGDGFTPEQSEKLNALPTATELDADIEEASREVFDDMWLAAVGSYGSIDHTHVEDGMSKPYYLNEIWLTRQEAVAILDRGVLTNENISCFYSGFSEKTTLPPRINVSVEHGTSVFSSAKVETVYCGYLIPDNRCFLACDKLHTITNIYAPNTDNVRASNIYKGCVALKSIKGITRTFAVDFSLEDSPLIDRVTLNLIVQKKQASDNAKSMTITVHPNVYAKLTGDTNNEAAAALTADELAQWQAVLTAASNKNISFATV